MIATALLALAAPAGIEDAAAPAQEMSAGDRWLAEADHALRQGRVEQARLMVGSAVQAGATGAPVNRLLAAIAFTDGKYGQALDLAKAQLVSVPDDPAMLEIGGMAALQMGHADDAFALLRRAAAFEGPRWQVLNALGVAADRLGHFSVAEASYRQALDLAPEEAKIFNNFGWSLLLQGRWAEARGPLERAVQMAPELAVAQRNLDLARMATSAELPARRSGEGDDEFAQRLNDAGVVAAAQGDKGRAVAAFTQAIHASSVYYEKAARNRDAVAGD